MGQQSVVQQHALILGVALWSIHPFHGWSNVQWRCQDFILQVFAFPLNIRDTVCGSGIIRYFLLCLRGGAMASDNLEDVLIQSGVDSALTSSLMMEGWSCQSFRMAAADIHGFEDVLQEWSSSTPLSAFQKACLRTAFQSLQPQQGPSASAVSTPTLSTTTPAGSWAEAFPPKLENAVLQAMKQKFMANYPSELIHADLFPSTRLVSLVHDQLSKKVWKWVPWKYRISLTRSEEISSNRAQKMPKIDHLGLHSLLFDDPPSIDVSNNAMGVNSIRNMLEVHDRAIALCQGAHLANLKAYTHKFIGFLTAKYDGDLRNPSVLEWRLNMQTKKFGRSLPSSWNEDGTWMIACMK